MVLGLRLGAILLVGLTVSRVLLFPETTKISDCPSIKSLNVLEKNLDTIKKSEPSSLSVWRQFQALLMEEFATINYETVSKEEMDLLFEKIKNLAMPILKSVMTQGAKNLSSLSSYECYLLNSMVESSMKIVKKGSIAYRFMTHMHKKLAKVTKTPYEYLQGDAQSHICQGQIKVFSWNTCLLPGKLPKVFSGLNPWQDRVDQIISTIKEQNADVICLQEVHSEPAAAKIFSALKSDYAHFYINMGPKIMGSQIADVGLNSGLFVASKYPIDNIHFEAFSSDEGQKMVNKGFFFGAIQGTEVGVSTCHLEPFNETHSLVVRQEELQHIIKFLSQQKMQVRLLTGDLNIPWGSGEAAETLLKTHFYDPYNKNRQNISLHSRTFSDVFVSKKDFGSCDILDYFLIFQVPGFEKYAFMTERVEGFDDVKGICQGSDHHGLVSYVVFPLAK